MVRCKITLEITMVCSGIKANITININSFIMVNLRKVHSAAKDSNFRNKKAQILTKQ